MSKKRIAFLALLTFLSLSGSSLSFSGDEPSGTGNLKRLEELQREFAELRFGMFMHYGIRTFTGGGWGRPNQDLSKFDLQGNRTDCAQWATAALSANMRFGLLTAKHHDGFCLWDSEFTQFDVASTPYKHDVVKEYVDAFRSKGLKVGLYYSVWDSTKGLDKNREITPEDMAFIRGQITELLSNYGKIDLFVIDGWFWRMGHRAVPYGELRELMRTLQPDCLFSEHTHLQALYHVDFPYFEGPFGAFPPEDNILPSALGKLMVRGNGWFWNGKTPGNECAGVGDLVEKHLKRLEPRYCNLTLNCPPNNRGKLDENIVTRLKEVGEAWKPDLSRPPLPAQGKQLIHPVMAQSVEADSGKAELLIDGQMYAAKHKNWTSDGPLPQAVILDLGACHEGLELLAVVPNTRCTPKPEASLTEGNVTRYAVYIGERKNALRKVAEGEWKADGKMKLAEFPGCRGRFVKFEILGAEGEAAIINEMEAGAWSSPPRKVE